MGGPGGRAEEPPSERRAEPDPESLVADVFFAMEQAEIDLPHIVLSRSAVTGEVGYSGPYATGLQAMEAAELEHAREVEGGGAGEVTFHVAALYPPLEADRFGDRPR
jgi:hypothetical protein